MYRKLIYLISFVLVFSLAGRALATTYDYRYTNAGGNGLWNQLVPPYNWERSPWPVPVPPVWTPSGPPEADLIPEDYIGSIYLTGTPQTRLLPLTIPAGYDADCTSSAEVFSVIFGPNWGLKLDIMQNARLGVSWAIFPMQDVNGLVDPNNPDNDPNRSVVNMYDGSEIYGPWETGGTLGGNRCEAICLGLSWWFAAPYVTWNMYGDSAVYTNALIHGGHLNLYGRTFDVLDYVQVGTRDEWTVPDELIRIDIWEGKMILPDDYVDEAVDWINRDILVAYGGMGDIIIDPNDPNYPDRVVVTAITDIIPCRPEYSWQYGDLTGNCVIDYADLDIMADEWLTSGIKADLIDDDNVNFKDYAVLTNNWQFLWP